MYATDVLLRVRRFNVVRIMDRIHSSSICDQLKFDADHIDLKFNVDLFKIFTILYSVV